MTVAIPEAAAAVAPAAAAAGPARAAAARPRTARARVISPATAPPPPRHRAAAAGPARPQSARNPARDRRREMFGRARHAAPTTRIHRGSYQPVILAEFVAAILLVALSPVASKKNPAGMSPYDGQDMIKLAALTLVYLILALVSTGGPGAGRFGAWFGGLVLLTVGLAEAAHLAQVIDLFGIGGKPPPADTQSGE